MASTEFEYSEMFEAWNICSGTVYVYIIALNSITRITYMYMYHRAWVSSTDCNTNNILNIHVHIHVHVHMYMYMQMKINSNQKKTQNICLVHVHVLYYYNLKLQYHVLKLLTGFTMAVNPAVIYDINVYLSMNSQCWFLDPYTRTYSYDYYEYRGTLNNMNILYYMYMCQDAVVENVHL